jgi:hypothetical protein
MSSAARVAPPIVLVVVDSSFPLSGLSSVALIEEERGRVDDDEHD